MTTTHTIRSAAAALLLAALALPAASLAGDPAGGAERKEGRAFVVVGEGGAKTTVDLSDGQLTVVTESDEGTSTRIVDMATVGLMASDAVGGALEGLDEVLAELGRMQFQYRAGQDNSLSFSYDDSEVEIDLDAIMAQVALAVQHGLEEIDTAAWTDHRGRWDEVSEDELRDELENLRDEMKELRRELRRLQAETE